MDQQANKQEPSSKEGGEVKNPRVGDWVWVKAQVKNTKFGATETEVEIFEQRVYVRIFECRPVEPDHDDHPVEFKVGDRVVSWSGRQGVVEAVNEIEGFPITVRHSMREQVSYKLGGVKHDDHPVEQTPKETTPKQPTRGQKLAERTMKAIWAANDAVNGTPVIKDCLTTESNSPKIPDGSSEGMRDAFHVHMYRLDNLRTDLARNPDGYVNWEVEGAWQAFQAGVKYQLSPLAPSPCMDGVNVDQFVDGIMEARGRASDLQVGDAVRFVSPGHDRHATKGVLKSIHHGPKNAYLFVSDCGQFHRYCTIAELEHYGKSDPVDIKGSMASLDGADTIQEGDLQWTDRDGKYRLCNFTIGMRVHEAIERGKAHGEKWVFYRKFEEVGE